MRQNLGINWALWPYMCNYAQMIKICLNGACMRLYGIVPRMRATVVHKIALNGFLRCYGINARLRRFRAYVGRVVLYIAIRSGGMPSGIPEGAMKPGAGGPLLSSPVFRRSH